MGTHIHECMETHMKWLHNIQNALIENNQFKCGNLRLILSPATAVKIDRCAQGDGRGRKEARKKTRRRAMMGEVKGEVEVCGWGRKHIVTLNTSGGYTVIKSSKVIRRAAVL